MSRTSDKPVALSRRAVLGAALPLAVLPVRSIAGTRQAGELAFLGMNGNLIHAARFDPATGVLSALGPVAEGLRPTWAVQHPRAPILYYTDEAGNDGASAGGVVAFRVDVVTGALDRIGDLRAGGGGTTHLWLDARSSTLIAANYGGGSVATLSIRPDGRLNALEAVQASSGSGPNRRQAAPHPHSSVVDPSGRFALIADLGADRVFIAPFDRATGRLGDLDPSGDQHYVLPPGSGPRHMAFHRNGRILYLINELTAEIHTLSWDHRAGRLTLAQTVSLNDAGFEGQSSGGEIATSHDGRFVYATNRGDGSLVVHSVDRHTGQLTRIQKLPCGGAKPWHFALHRSGRWMLVSNRDSNAVRTFGVDGETGFLTDTQLDFASPAPVHVHFLAI